MDARNTVSPSQLGLVRAQEAATLRPCRGIERAWPSLFATGEKRLAPGAQRRARSPSFAPPAPILRTRSFWPRPFFWS